MNKIIVITGPTGVGKTKLSIELAKLYNGEIINADSVQIYKRLNIGSAKIKEVEKEGISHHLFDIKEPTEEYNIYNYQKDSRKIIKRLQEENKTPILVGGSGLYIMACLYDFDLKKEASKNNYEESSNEEILEEINKINKNHSIHVNNRKRLVRQLNKLINNKEIQKESKLLYDVTFVGLTANRDVLYERINTRVDKMFDEGLVNEVEELYKEGVDTKAMLSIGYKELYSYFANETTLEEAKELIKRNSRRYAKRQYTWFNNQMNVKWFDVNLYDFKATIEEVDNYIKKGA